MKRVMLYFGSFNPVHKGHIALAEYVVSAGLCDELIIIVSPQSPYKVAGELAPEMDRFEMAEIACAASKYPDRIKSSIIEFLLPKPSYTIDTLHHLKENYGSDMQFSILLGSDQIAHFDGWKEYKELLSDYPVYVYPRRGQEADRFLDRITILNDAPLLDYSSTEVRELLAKGGDTQGALIPAVAEYIHKKGLWSLETRMRELTTQIEEFEARSKGREVQTGDGIPTDGEVAGAIGADVADVAKPADAALYVERGKLHYRHNAFGEALNDFNRALRLDDGHAEARQYTQMVQEILEFRYKDIYNP